MFRRSHFLDNWFTDGGEVSHKQGPPFSQRNTVGTHFWVDPRGTVRLEGLGWLNPVTSLGMVSASICYGATASEHWRMR
jgi:hypothetical protein